MIKNQTIITFFQYPWNYHCAFEKQTSLYLSRVNKIIIYSGGDNFSIYELLFNKMKRDSYKKAVRTNSKNLIKFIPINYLPFSRFSFIRQINKTFSLILFYLFIKNNIARKRPIFWLFSFTEINFTKLFKKMVLVYDCSDPILSDDPLFKKKTQLENKLVKKASIVFAFTENLYKKMSILNKKTFIVPLGCETRYFSKSKHSKIPTDIKNIRKPIIGISGGVDSRLNIALVKYLAKKNKKWSLVIIGPLIPKDSNFLKTFKNALRQKNIFFLGNKNKWQLSNYYKCFDVCLIPYNFVTNKHINNPMRFYEYFAVGKPVVSVPVETLMKYRPYVKFAKSKVGFYKAIRQFLNTSEDSKVIKIRKSIAISNNLENKFKIMNKIIDKEGIIYYDADYSK